MKYLIIGTGRSGTGYMSKLLNYNSIKCGHESVFGIPSNLNSYIISKKYAYDV